MEGLHVKTVAVFGSEGGGQDQGLVAGRVGAKPAGVSGKKEVKLGHDEGQVAVGVVLASGGYPGTLDSGHEIHGLDLVGRECPEVSLRYAGVSARDTALVASGGRVLTVVSRATTYAAAISAAYDAVGRIQFQGMQYRTDIGARAVTTPTP